ncbi:hypothetical protein EGW08_011470 [Elysia chlorotica]|uniref:Integrase catalytic domain-containing protein n=1 Tax=Elysia chlorotica TaxID=188477 RepID=A0A433TGM6_ELYCH|nr:hypothetical protein EGW08_011470 [Elysia chlorotica]
MDVPFKRVAVDLVGPIDPTSEDGHRYILTLVDYATRYPEAVTLKRIVAEALVNIYSRLGVPEKILSDQGTQFMSACMREESTKFAPFELLYGRTVRGPMHILEQLWTKYIEEDELRSSYQYVLERREGLETTWEMAQKKLNYDRGTKARKFKPGDDVLVLLPTDTNKLLMQWKGPYKVVAVVGINDYRVKMGRKEKTVHANLLKRYVSRLDSETEDVDVDSPDTSSTQCARGDKADSVDVSPSIEPSKEITRTQSNAAVTTNGPASSPAMSSPETAARETAALMWMSDVTASAFTDDRIGQVPVETPSLPLEFYEAEERLLTCGLCISLAGVAAIREDPECGDQSIDEMAELCPWGQKETVKDLRYGHQLTDAQAEKVKSIVDEHQSIFTDLTGSTTLAEHRIELTSGTPIRQKPYGVPFSMRKSLRDEMRTMEEMGIIRKSSSPYAAHVVVVKKKNGSNRMCIDYRRLTKVTVFDPHPATPLQKFFNVSPRTNSSAKST